MKNSVSILLLIINVSAFGQSAQKHNVTPNKNIQGMWGFVDENKKEVVEHKFNWVDPKSHHSLYRVFIGEIDEQGKAILGKGKYGFIKNDGTKITPCEYDWALSTGMELHIVFKGKTSYNKETDTYHDDGRWGYMDNKGQENFPLIKCKDIDHIVFGFAKIFKNDLQGVINEKGEYIVPCSFDEVSFDKYSDGIVVKKNKKQGMYNKKGEILIPTLYDTIGYSYKGYTQVMNNNNWGLTDSTGTLIFPCKYESIAMDGSDKTPLIYIKENGKEGYLNMKGEIVVPIVYDKVEIYRYSNFFVIQVLKKKKWGLYTSDGEQQLLCKYDELNLYHDYNTYIGAALLKNEGKRGLASRHGKLILPCIYDEIDYRDREILIAKKGTKWGVMDTNGMEVLPFIYSNAKYDDHNHLIHVFYENKEKNIKGFGAVTKDGLLTKKWYDKISVMYAAGYAQVTKNGKIGIIDTLGNEILPCEYDWIESFNSPEKICVFKGKVEFNVETFETTYTGKYGFVNQDNEILIPLVYEEIKYASENSYKVKVDGKWGIITHSGEEKIPAKYDWIQEKTYSQYYQAFKGEVDPHAYFPKGSGFGYVDTLGNEITKFIYEGLQYANGGLIKVKIKDKWGVINDKDELIVPCKYDDIGGDFYEDMLRVFVGSIDFNNEYEYEEYNGLYGFVDKNGEEVIPCQFTYSDQFYEGKARVKKDGKKYYINTKGETVKE
jgi:hypothetical protein